MKLFAKILDIDLLKKCMHELGTAFYRSCGDNLVEVLYFSGNRLVQFKREIKQSELESVKAQAFPVKKIEIDEATRLVKITQKE